MCWVDCMAIPIVLKKSLKVYKVGNIKTSGIFISLYQNFRYYKSQIMPTVKINPKFERAKSNMYSSGKIGIFEIPVGATVYINYISKEVVSTDIKYLGLLKE